MEKGNTDPAWVVPSPRSGKFFRGKSGGMAEFSPITQSTPAMQSTAYEGGYFPSSDQDGQQRNVHQDWPMAKEPLVTANEVVTPAPTSFSNDEIYDLSTSSGTWGAHDLRHNTDPQAVIYESVGAGQTSHGGSRPTVKRKEVSRKSVPGRGSVGGIS